MNDNHVDRILECMALNENNSNIQRVQTEHRLKLSEFWGIKKGSRVLEIGCGQGDTTAVLAYLVGEEGLVHGVDIASPSYGSPITLGDSADYLMRSMLGKQIKIDFEMDILSPKVDFPENSFDFIVLSHCSWYFKSSVELKELLTKIRRWGKKLCYAEWDSRINTIEQLPHFLAILIQAQYECFKEYSTSNVRTLFTPTDVKDVVEKSGWSIIKEQSISSNALQDGKWEVDLTLNEYQSGLDDISGIPSKLKSLIKSEVNLLEESIKNHDIQPMSTFAFIAE